MAPRSQAAQVQTDAVRIRRASGAAWRSEYGKSIPLGGGNADTVRIFRASLPAGRQVSATRFNMGTGWQSVVCYHHRRMISNLHGTVKKHIGGEVTVDVHDVGYRVMTPLNVWERIEDGAIARLWISTYVREDRLALFGFLEENMRTLFEKLLERPGIGPRLALELCGCPAHLLAQAIAGDAEILQMVKGVGKKSAEKLVIELKSLASKHPELFVRPNGITEQCPSIGEDDAVAALKGLGYDHPTILTALAALPKNLRTPEERITAALRSL